MYLHAKINLELNHGRTYRSNYNNIYKKHQLNPGLCHALDHLLEPLVPLTNLLELTELYQKLYDKQQLLGICSIFMGYFLQDWQEIQHQYRKLNFLPTNHQQARQAVSSILFQHVYLIWDIRNQDLHEQKNNHIHQTLLPLWTTKDLSLLLKSHHSIKTHSANHLAINKIFFAKPSTEKFCESTY